MFISKKPIINNKKIFKYDKTRVYEWFKQNVVWYYSKIWYMVWKGVASLYTRNAYLRNSSFYRENSPYFWIIHQLHNIVIILFVKSNIILQQFMALFIYSLRGTLLKTTNRCDDFSDVCTIINCQNRNASCVRIN